MTIYQQNKLSKHGWYFICPINLTYFLYSNQRKFMPRLNEFVLRMPTRTLTTFHWGRPHLLTAALAAACRDGGSNDRTRWKVCLDGPLGLQRSINHQFTFTNLVSSLTGQSTVIYLLFFIDLSIVINRSQKL